MLSKEQIGFYRENGYLVVEEVFSAAEIAALNRVTEDFIEASRRVPASDAVYDLAPDHGSERPRVRRIKDPQDRHPLYEAAARSERLLDILGALVGPAIRFDHGKLNFKPAGGGGAVEWHQDWAFYPHSNDDLLAVGIMLEDCGPENGPLMVIPGSHRGPVHDHHHDDVFVGAFDPTLLGAERERAVMLTGRAGACTFHHVRTAHGSAENLSKRARPLLLFGYAAVDAWPLVDRPDLADFDARILRGQPTLAPRQVALPIRIPLPRVAEADSIFDDQTAVGGRSFGPTPAAVKDREQAT